MATVFLAVQQSLQRQVALKVLHADRIGVGDETDDEYAHHERFVNEGRIVAGLSHPHIVQIYDIGATASTMFLAMEYVAGGDLQSRLSQAFEPRKALEILIRIGTALAEAHSNGVVHRDVKPANILFRADGTPLLSDFGIAKHVEDPSLTTTGHVLGSPYYISPEQADIGVVDGRADIYSLGIIFYEMLTGSRPYQGLSPVKVILQHLQAPIPKLPSELSGYQPLLNKMMAKDRDDRFADAQTFARDALGFLKRPASAPAEDGTPERPSPQAIMKIVPEVCERFRAGILEDIQDDRIVLPSLPDVVLRVRKVLESPDATGASIAKVIASDPALSAHVLRVANSAFYCAQEPVKDLQRAVVRLGAAVVSQVLMMLVVAQMYDARSRPKMKTYLAELWRHSTVVATISESIAAKIDYLDRDAAMLAGLIHDIGALPILVWAEQIPHVISDPLTVGGIVQHLHSELGAAILQQWNYPDDLIEVAAQHEDVHREHAGRADYTDIVIIANILAKQTPETPTEWHTLPAARALGLSQADGEALRDAALAESASLASTLAPRAAA
ncbi:MAG: HDOD domain-containing protein [Gammaproteobacteria bacterium]|nr:HDOD domain-containing protein [Gammaproteobacteria bacterium]